MKENGTSATVASALLVIGIAIGVGELFFRPFLLAPIALVSILTGVMLSSQNRRLGTAAAVSASAFFVIGAALAVWGSHPLY